MMTGEVIFGGVGSGLYGMLLFVLLAVFIAGLMVGRTPEYLGKKIEAREVKLVMIGTIVVPLLVLVATAIAIASKYGDPSIYNPGPQGFSETLYAYTSQGNNNGSAFAGYTGFVQPNAPGNVGAFGITFADLLGGVAMLFGRFVPLLAALAVAGSLATQAGLPGRPRHLPHRHPDLRRAPDLRRDPRRGAHLLPRRPARPGRPGPHRLPRLPELSMRRDLTASIIAVVVFTLLFGLAYPLVTTGVSQVLFRGQGRRQPDRARRRDRRLGADRPELPDPHGGPRGERGKFGKKQVKEPDPSYFQPRPSVTGYSGNVTFFNNLGPNNKELSQLFAALPRGLPRARGRVHARARRRRTSRSTRSPPPARASTRTSRSRTPASRRTGSPRSAASTSTASTS